MVLCKANKGKIILFLTIFIIPFFCFGCGGDSGGDDRVIDSTIPENDIWTINTIFEKDVSSNVSPKLDFFHSNGRLHMAFYDENPDFDASVEDSKRYRVRYRAFNTSDVSYLNDSNTINETVNTLVNDGRSIGGLSIGVSGTTPIVAYTTYKELIQLDNADLNNQGDIMIGVRDSFSNWRNETGAFGYVSPDRNPVFRDGLASADISLIGDENGNANLGFQFYYEGIDSYNYDFPDMRFISQPINNFAQDVYSVANLEETVEGNTYISNESGMQYYQGGSCDLVQGANDSLSVFYHVDYTENSPADEKGLKVSTRINGQWQSPVWLERGIDVVDISGAVMSDGRLAAVYTVKDGADLFNQDTIPFSLKYVEQKIITTQVPGPNGIIVDEISYEWGEPEIVNYNTISGRYCSLAFDSEDNPVTAYFDEMNFSLNRFFSRIKISKRTGLGTWDVLIINPEHVGLSNNISPYDVKPGTHDSYYIGKYNYLWLDSNDKINLCTYSTISKKAYLFTEK